MYLRLIFWFGFPQQQTLESRIQVQVTYLRDDHKAHWWGEEEWDRKGKASKDCTVMQVTSLDNPTQFHWELWSPGRRHHGSEWSRGRCKKSGVFKQQLLSVIVWGLFPRAINSLAPPPYHEHMQSRLLVKKKKKKKKKNPSGEEIQMLAVGIRPGWTVWEGLKGKLAKHPECLLYPCTPEPWAWEKLVCY